jgi:hypothetical protein
MSDRQDTNPASGRSMGAATLWLALAFVLLAYPLSIGPVARAYRGTKGGPPKLIQKIYEPLIQFSSSSQIGRDLFLGWYVRDLWGVK